MMFRLSFQPISEKGILLLVFFLALGFLVILFSLKSKRLSNNQKKVITGLRLLALLLIGFLMLRPVAIITTTQQLPASLFMLLDQSESMCVEDEVSFLSRFDRMKKTLAQCSSELEQIANEYTVHPFGFDSVLSPYQMNQGMIAFPDAPHGTETALGAALADVLHSSAGKRSLGVILLSDGSQRTKPGNTLLPQDVAVRLRDAGLPIYAVCFGTSGEQSHFRDIAVRDLFHNEQVFINNELIISGQIRIAGYTGEKIPIILHFEDEKGAMIEVARNEVIPSSDQETFYPYHFVYSPSTAGEHKLQVIVPPFPKELVATNNELSSFVRVVDRRLRVLYLEGTRRFEQKYLCIALDSSADIQVDYWRPHPDTTIRALDKTEAERIAFTTESRPSLYPTAFESGGYAAYILGDLDATALKKEEIDALSKRINEGAGLIFTAGDRSLARGGFKDTSLEAVSPVKLQQTDRIPLNMDIQTFDKSDNPTQKLLITGSFRLKPVSKNPHFLTRFSIDNQKNDETWNVLPSFDYLYRSEPKPGAQILVTAQSNAESYPFLIAQQFGAGRVALITSDSTWKWWMNGFEAEHRKFWRQLVLWAAKMDEVPKGELAIEMDRSRFLCGEMVDFRLIYHPLEEEKRTHRAQTVVIHPNGDREELSLLDQNKTFAGTVRSTALEGDYLLEAVIIDKITGEEIKKAHTRFLVYSKNLELEHPGANPLVLANLATVTGGKSLLPEELPELLSTLLQKREHLIDTRDSRKTLYDTWPMFAILVAVLTAEWYIRKRWGMV